MYWIKATHKKPKLIKTDKYGNMVSNTVLVYLQDNEGSEHALTEFVCFEGESFFVCPCCIEDGMLSPLQGVKYWAELTEPKMK